MPIVHFIHKDGHVKSIDAPKGLSIMEVAVKNNIPAIEGACGGGLSCATCHVYVHPDWFQKVLPKDGEISDEENDMLDLAFDLKKLSRLSCQITVSDALDGLVLALPGSRPDWV